ncbi:MAG: hypothetical protein KatS3mg009_3386 [Acidimicrobiia bacterium]|nr:MAG: hypothetical protein KatS3mg009_3386 [Acidimicrobiia bacterium]
MLTDPDGQPGPVASAPPEEVLPGGPGTRGPRRRPPRWSVVLTALLLGAAAVLFAGSMVELPYYTISPGDAFALHSRIDIEGAPTYTPDGEVWMLFVRQRARVNVWEWLRASIDPDVDLFREEEISGGRSPEELDVESDAQMTASQTAAKRAALEAAGYEVPLADGVQVLAVIPSRPAAGVLEAGDVIEAVNGTPLEDANDLGETVRGSPTGTRFTIDYVRDGERRRAEIESEAGPDGTPVVGVYVAGAYDFPVDIEIDTATVGGPSAGLAMTLTILDELTPGDLTGGLDVAATGTIEEDGSVGEIGGLGQKAVAARRAGADLMLVPACTTEEIREQCEHDLARARERAGDGVEVHAVASLDEVLAVLVAAGGDPVEPAPGAR